VFGLLGVIAAATITAVLFLVFRDDPDRGEFAAEYTDRGLLIPPGAEYRLPSVEDELLMPDFRAFIDPDEPLDSELLDGLEPDIRGEIRREFTEEVETELEELLFER
jgi:hypothetical protein